MIKKLRNIASNPAISELPIFYADVADTLEYLARFKQYFDDLYGEGLEIANWHLNGDLESFDNFFEAAESGGLKKYKVLT